MFNRILVAIADPEMDRNIFEVAIDLARSADARLLFLHVKSSNPDGDLEMLRSLHDQATTYGLETDIAELKGEPSGIICDRASRWGANLIITGRHVALPSESQSVSTEVLEHAPCSVLIVQHLRTGEPLPNPDVHSRSTPVESTMPMVTV